MSMTNPPSSPMNAEMLRVRNAALEDAARIADTGCLVPPDGGSPTEAEREMCEGIASAIRLKKLNGAEAVLAAPGDVAEIVRDLEKLASEAEWAKDARLLKFAAQALQSSSAETAEAIEARDRYKKMYNAEVKAAAESKARCNEALGWSEQQLQAAKSSHEGQLRNTLAFKAEKEAAELRLAEAVNIIWRGTFNNKADEDRAQKFVNGPVG